MRQNAIEERRLETDRNLAKDRQQEETLQAYIGTMTEMLLDRNLLQSQSDGELQAVAEAQTLTTLRRLNGERKGILLRFLSSTRLITLESGKIESLIRLSGTDLSGSILDQAWLLGADLGETNLSDANLNRAILRGAMLFSANLTGAKLEKAVLHEARMEKAILVQADLKGAYLRGANLTLADLTEADLLDADLEGADLLGTNLLRAKVSESQLSKTRTLQGTILPDGTKHE